MMEEKKEKKTISEIIQENRDAIILVAILSAVNAFINKVITKK